MYLGETKVEAMPTKLKVSVVVPTKNRCQALKKCLDSLLRQTYKNFEIVIVDGGSTDGTENLVNEYGRRLAVKFVKQKKRGLVNAVNDGWNASNGDIVIRTDDDIIATREWLQKVVETFCISDDIGGVTGPTIIPEELRKYRDIFYFQKSMKEGHILWNLIGKIYFDYFLEGELLTVGKFFRSGGFSLGSNYIECLGLREPIEVDHHEACNMAVRRNLLEEIGGFDTAFIGIGDYGEPDVSFKIRELGYKIMFNPKAIVYHLPSKEGVFKDRPNSYGRILNFINFYFRHIRPNTLDKFVRFNLYLLFLNGYFIYKFITTRQINQLGCRLGTIVGLAKNIFRVNAWRGG